MTDTDNDTIRQLIRLANEPGLDEQSRQTICDVALYIKSLQNVSQKLDDLDSKLQEFNCAYSSSN